MNPSSSPPWFAPTLAALMERRDLPATHMCRIDAWNSRGRVRRRGNGGVVGQLCIIKGETAEELAAAAAVLRDIAFLSMRAATMCWTLAALAATAAAPSTSARRRRSWLPARACRSSSTAIGPCPVAAAVPMSLPLLGVRIELDVPLGTALPGTRGHDVLLGAACSIPLCSTSAKCGAGLGCGRCSICLGPLANPAGASYQLLGVGRDEMARPARRRAGPTGNAPRSVGVRTRRT